MRAVDENAFDNGFGVGEAQQLNSLDSELGIGIGGGSGAGISYGGGGGSPAGFIPIVDTPNVANTDNKEYILYSKNSSEILGKFSIIKAKFTVLEVLVTDSTVLS